MNQSYQLIEVNDNNRRELFNAAYNGSYYTITGCGGDLNEWIEGYADMLEKERIGNLKLFIAFNGRDMNTHYGLTDSIAYPDDLTFLMFPLDGLEVEKLAIFKIRMSDRWFDDIVDNDQRQQEALS